MKWIKSIALTLLASTAFAGTHVIQGDSVTFSSLTVNGGILLNGTCTGSGCGGGGSTNGTVSAAPLFSPAYYTLSWNYYDCRWAISLIRPGTYFVCSAGSSAAPFYGQVSGANVLGNISGNAANISGNLPASQVAAGSLGSSVIASSIGVASVGVPQLNFSGTPSGTTFARGDGSWATPVGGTGGEFVSLEFSMGLSLFLLQLPASVSIATRSMWSCRVAARRM